ncbi:MAG TPA: class I adenylate-forming enzyme family protein [Burkholderiales bacterium]|nr:class I adenylate-forming enzyme family protein [Burkholderiales bacterium]
MIDFPGTVPYQSLAELVDDAARKFGDAPLWISIDDGTRISHADFAELTVRCAEALRARGVTFGTHVAVMLPAVPAYPIVWLALARIGAVMVPVNMGYKSADLEYVLRDSDASWLVIDEAAVPAFESIATKDQIVEPANVIVHRRGEDFVEAVRAPRDRHGSTLVEPRDDGVGRHPCEDDATRHPRGDDTTRHPGGDDTTRHPRVGGGPVAGFLDSRLRGNDVGPDTLMSIQYTSGSTGFPKGCMLTQDYWLVLGLVRAHQGPPPKRLLIDKPMSYMGGMWRFLVALYLGSAAVVARKFSLSTLQDRLVEWEIDYFGATDAVAKLPDHPGLAKLKMAWISIAGLSKNLHETLERKLHAPVRELYGLTETGSTLYMPTGAAHMVGSGSCGVPAPFRACRIVGPKGQDVARGEVGELWVSGRAILQGYYNKPEATREAFVGEWFRTGDLFRQDEHGYFYIQGRIKDSIRRSGENISAREIETIASGIPGVFETAAVAVKDELRGEEVKLCLVLQPGYTREQVTPEAVAAFCAERLAAFKVPRYVAYIDDMPRTSSNKIAKTELVQPEGQVVFDRVKKVWL